MHPTIACHACARVASRRAYELVHADSNMTCMLTRCNIRHAQLRQGAEHMMFFDDFTRKYASSSVVLTTIANCPTRTCPSKVYTVHVQLLNQQQRFYRVSDHLLPVYGTFCLHCFQYLMLSSHQAKRVMGVLCVDCCNATAAASRTLDHESHADTWMQRNVFQSHLIPFLVVCSAFGVRNVSSSWLLPATTARDQVE
jgi:hypothetical protein